MNITDNDLAGYAEWANEGYSLQAFLTDRLSRAHRVRGHIDNFGTEQERRNNEAYVERLISALRKAATLSEVQSLKKDKGKSPAQKIQAVIQAIKNHRDIEIALTGLGLSAIGAAPIIVAFFHL